MTSIDLSKVIFCSIFGGLGNTEHKTFSQVINSQTLNQFGSVSVVRSIDISNIDSLSMLMVNLGGLESEWRPVNGYIYIKKPSNSNATYLVSVNKYFANGKLNILCKVDSLQFDPVTIPTITFNFDANIYNAPFN